MVDIRLLYPLEKTEAAARLADAISAAGYRVDREALADGRSFPDVAAEAGKAKVLLLIWSRGLVSAAMEGTRLASARRHPNFIEVSADGIEPAAGAEASPVVLLCGWRGQPFHPGWQRILAEIKRLCGSRDLPRKRPPVSGDPVRGSDGASVPKRPPVRAAVAAGALIAALLGVGALYDRSAGPGIEARSAVAAVGEASRPPSAVAAAASVSSAPAVMAAQQPDDLLTAPAPAPATAGVAVPAPAPTVARTAPARPAATQSRSSRERLAAASRREVKRYSRKHSKTMRLFCQRSGRSTPQCRTFARSMRDADG